MSSSLLSIGCVVAGFVVGALISEASLRGVSNETRGALLAAFSKLRLMHLAVLLGLVALSFILPGSFLPAVIAYLSIATVLALRKLRSLDLPTRCRRLQALSVGSVLVGVVAAGIVSWLL